MLALLYCPCGGCGSRRGLQVAGWRWPSRPGGTEQAEEEHAPLSELDKAFATYSEAMAARAKAGDELEAKKDELEAKTAAEDEAERALEAALRRLLPEQAGSSSGVVKAEA